MPSETSKLWLTFALAFAAVDSVVFFTVFLLRHIPTAGRLNDTVVFGTIYLTLVPWELAEAPVFKPTTQMFDPPNALGWIIVVLSWALLYAGIGYLLSILVKTSSEQILA